MNSSPAAPGGWEREEPDLYQETVSALSVMVSGTVLQTLLRTAVLVLLARLLQPAEFGLVSAAYVVISFSEIFSQCGVGAAVVRHPRLAPLHLRVAFTASLLGGALLAALLVLAAPLLAAFFRMEDLIRPLRLMSLAFLIQGATVLPQALLQREMRFRELVRIHILSYVFGYGVCGVVLAWLGAGAWALVYAFLVQELARGALLLATRPVWVRWSLDSKTLRELLGFGTGFSAGRLANFLALQGDNLVVGRWLGASALGLYGRAYQLMVVPSTLVGNALQKVLFPALARLQEDRARLGEVYRRGLALVATTTLPLSAFVVLFAPQGIELLLGRGWEAVVLPLRILAVAMVFRAGYKVSDALAEARGAVYRRAGRQAAYALAVFVGAWLGCRWGVSGVAAGVGGAILLNYLLMAQLCGDLTGTSAGDLLQAHLPGLALAAAVILGSGWLTLLPAPLRPSPALTMALGLLSATLALAVPLALFPRFFLGEEGMRLGRSLLERMPIRGKRVAARIRNRYQEIR